jgi:hypothetical protein
VLRINELDEEHTSHSTFTARKVSKNLIHQPLQLIHNYHVTMDLMDLMDLEIPKIQEIPSTPQRIGYTHTFITSLMLTIASRCR